MIKLTSLNKYFYRGKPNEIHVINDVTLDLPRRGMVAFFGRSGCGKTTLLNVIGGLDRYASGSVEIDGKRVAPDADEIRNRRVGYIFQNYNLNPSLTCYDNVADALRLCGMTEKDNGEEIKSRVTAALTAVGLARYAQRYPDTLSGGQKQRIAIARAIVKAPDVILADEPTGNLDETNTVMIMDILREIANDRLVLLVTHEENLAYHYCDTIIGLSDGKIVSTVENAEVGGYVARNKNHIYLGELDHTPVSDGAVKVDYYGLPTDSDIKLTVVNSGGKLFLRVDTPGVHVIDEAGETRIHDGVFAPIRTEEKKAESLDLSLLTPIEGKNYGKLFTLGSAIKSGYTSLFGVRVNKKGKKKRGQRMLRFSMFLFAFVFVLLAANFSTGIGSFSDTRAGVNQNIFYLNVPDDKAAEFLEAVGRGEGSIDGILTLPRMDMDGERLSIDTGMFESFTRIYSDYSANVVFMSHEYAKNLPLVCGDTGDLGDESIVLSSAAAEQILKDATLGYITEPEDLIGSTLNYPWIDGRNNLKIAAVVQSDDICAYLSPMMLARYYIESQYALSVIPASDYGLELDAGQVYIGYTTDTKLLENVPTPEEGLDIRGIHFDIRHASSGNPYNLSYGDWYYDTQGRYPPDIVNYENKAEYYRYFGDYLFDLYLSGSSDVAVICYIAGVMDKALYLLTGDNEYYAAERVREITGSYPESRDDLYLKIKELGIDPDSEIGDLWNECYRIYQSLDLGKDWYRMRNLANIYVSDEDYIRLSGALGKSHWIASNENYYYYEYEGGQIKGTGDLQNIAVIHSTDPAATDAFLRRMFEGLPTTDEVDVFDRYPIYVSPEIRMEYVTFDISTEITASALSLTVCLAISCVCMFFIMRSSMLTRIKQIGIYRAVGVSRKNLIFRYAVESGVLTALTVLIGYICSSALLIYLESGAAADLFYYPIWLAFAVLCVLTLSCIVCGVLPIAGLLRRTPAEILSKYDI